MEQLARNLYSSRVPLPGSPLKALTCYILKGGERNLIVDVGFNNDECERAVLAFMEQAGATPENTDLFITHMHVDHSGLLARLKRPQNRVYISARDSVYIENFHRTDHWDWIIRCSNYAGVPQARQLTAQEHVAYQNRPGPAELTTLAAGDRLRVGELELELEVLDLSGHTPGQIGMWNQEKGWLFCGDHILSGISSNITMWDAENDYLQLFLSNLLKVRGMPVKRLFPAHRAAPTDLNARIDQLLRHHEERLRRMLEVLREAGGPCTAYYVAGRIDWSGGKTLDDFTAQQHWFACSETLANLQHLYFTGSLTCAADENGTRWYSISGA